MVCVYVCVALPLLWALCMVNMLMVMICSMCVLPSREGPCWSSVLNSCRTRLATPGKDSMLYRQDTHIHKNAEKKTQRHTQKYIFQIIFSFLQTDSVHEFKSWNNRNITHPTLVKSFPWACRKLRINLLFSWRKRIRPKEEKKRVTNLWSTVVFSYGPLQHSTWQENTCPHPVTKYKDRFGADVTI